MSSSTDPIVSTPPLPPTPPSSTEDFRQIFVGPSGIRAGWRFLIFLALLIALQFSVRTIESHVPLLSGVVNGPLNGTLTLSFEIPFELLSIFTVFLATFIMARIEKRPLAAFGIPLQGALGRLFWQGVLWGLALETIEMLLISSMGGFSFGSVALAGAKLAEYAALWAIGFFLVGINEEFTFRGYAQFTLATGMGFWPSAVLLSVLFGAGHLFNPNEGWVGALSVVMFGLFLCFTLRRTGNLWFAIGFHAAADYAETFIYSVPDSGFLATGHLLNSSIHGSHWLTGGNIGPEGSVFVFVLLGLAFPLFAWFYPAKPQENAIQAAAPQ